VAATKIATLTVKEACQNLTDAYALFTRASTSEEITAARQAVSAATLWYSTSVETPWWTCDPVQQGNRSCRKGLPRIIHRLDAVGFVHEDYPLVYTAGSTSEGIANAKSNHAFNALLRERSDHSSFDHSSFFEMAERLAPSARYHLCTSVQLHNAICLFCVPLPLFLID
jgi:hypothetical protein